MWVRVNGIGFHCSGDRHDCAKLSYPLTSQNGIFEYVRLMWIIGGLTSEPCCLAAPLFKASRSTINAQSEAQKAAVNCFPPVSRIPQRLVFFSTKMLHRLEQVQFVTARNCELGLVNTFFHSNIISTTPHSCDIESDSEGPEPGQ